MIFAGGFSKIRKVKSNKAPVNIVVQMNVLIMSNKGIIGRNVTINNYAGAVNVFADCESEEEVLLILKLKHKNYIYRTKMSLSLDNERSC
jgi:hypothetical protein